MDTDKYKTEIAAFMRRMYRLKLTTTLGGNISMLLPDGTMIITPSATDKGEIQAEDIGMMDLEGKIIGKQFAPSIETRMHIQVYKNRPDIRAVVHAHPATVCAFAGTSASIDNKLIVESYFILGEIGYANYFPMGTEELANEVAEVAKSSNCIVMKKHGAITIGKNMLEAFDRMEVLENAAKMTLITRSDLQKFHQPLTERQIKDIDRGMAGK